MLLPTRIRISLVAAVTLAGMGAATAQENAALITALIRKGVLSSQEAEEIRAELMVENASLPAGAVASGKHTNRLGVGMRMQVQYANLDADSGDSGPPPPTTNHAFLRRMYFTLKSGLGAGWGAQFTYDFAGGSYDDAFVSWKPSEELSFDFGLRKVNTAYEERRTSGDLRAIERSGVTRYFVEANNGRRLGAASYRIGAFLDWKKDLRGPVDLIYGAAITTPERNETFSLASSSGDRTNNRMACWSNVGLTGKLGDDQGSWLLGGAAGYLPDQGGFGPVNLGRGHDLVLYSVHADMTSGPFSLLAEYLMADVQAGRPDGGDALPRGYFVQPGMMLTSRIELVVRYQSLNTDGRGLTLADVIRSAPASGTMNAFREWYAGVNWYVHGDDLKLQLGAARGEAKDAITGMPASATAIGIRSQLQIQF